MKTHNLIYGILFAAECLEDFELTFSSPWNDFAEPINKKECVGLYYLYDTNLEHIVVMSDDEPLIAQLTLSYMEAIDSCEGHCSEVYQAVTFCSEENEIITKHADIVDDAMHFQIYPTIFWTEEE